jgi:hypothetical protein
MLKLTQDLRLVAEPLEHGGRGHRRSDYLQRNGPVGMFLPRLKNHAHPTFADFANQGVAADPDTGAFLESAADVPGAFGPGGGLHETFARLGVAAEQPLEFCAKLRVARALLIEECTSLRERQIGRTME